MNKAEVEKLKKESGCSARAVYKAARRIGRVPQAWEVVLYEPRRGRPPKYRPIILSSTALTIDAAMRLLIFMAEEDLELVNIAKYKVFVDRVVAKVFMAFRGGDGALFVGEPLASLIHEYWDGWAPIEITKSEKEEQEEYMMDAGELMIGVIRYLKGVVGNG